MFSVHTSANPAVLDSSGTKTVKNVLKLRFRGELEWTVSEWVGKTSFSQDYPFSIIAGIQWGPGNEYYNYKYVVPYSINS